MHGNLNWGVPCFVWLMSLIDLRFPVCVFDDGEREFHWYPVPSCRINPFERFFPMVLGVGGLAEHNRVSYF